MIDVLHSLSVKLNLPIHLATLGCFIKGITDMVQEVVVTPRGGDGKGGQPRGGGGVDNQEDVAGVDNQQEVVALVDNQEMKPLKGVKRGAGDNEPPSNLPASRTRSKQPQIS